MIRYEWKVGDPVPGAWPDWMKAARIQHCVIEVEDSGWVVWRGGVWLGGEWRGGESKPRCRWHICGHGDIIHIGCKKRTIAEWDEFFAGTAVYETPRDSEAFRLIRAAYLAQLAWQLALAESTPPSSE